MPIKKWPLDGIPTNIQPTEDLLKENSRISQKPSMSFQTTAEDQLMIEWFHKNPHFKMPTEYLIGFTDKTKWLVNKRKNSLRHITLEEGKTLTKFLVSIKIPQWKTSPMLTENFPSDTIQNLIQTTKKLAESSLKLIKLIKPFPIKQTDQHTTQWPLEKLFQEEPSTFSRTSLKTDGWTCHQKRISSNQFSAAAEDDPWCPHCGVKVAGTEQECQCLERLD